jgi:hypothetical protein
VDGRQFVRQWRICHCLVFYNWRYLKLARDQTTAALAQAALARATLENLQAQIMDQQELERHSALVVLQSTSTQVVFWRGHAAMEVRPKTDPVQLLPDDWSVLAIYVARRVPSLVGRIRVASHDLREAENLLNRVIQGDLRGRAGNSSTKVILNSLYQRLDQIKAAFDELESVFMK